MPRGKPLSPFEEYSERLLGRKHALSIWEEALKAPDDELRASDIAETLGCQSSDVSNEFNRLEELGLVARDLDRGSNPIVRHRVQRRFWEEIAYALVRLAKVSSTGVKPREPRFPPPEEPEA